MKLPYIVLFPYELVLSNWRLREDGTVEFGYVINGCWYYFTCEKFNYACHSDGVDYYIDYVTKFPRRTNDEYYVVINSFSDYNSAIDLGKTMKPTDPGELLLLQELNSNMNKLEVSIGKKRNYDLIWSDDVPF